MFDNLKERATVVRFFIYSMLIIQCHKKILAEIKPPSIIPQIQAQNKRTTTLINPPNASLTLFVIISLTFNLIILSPLSLFAPAVFTFTF